MDSNHTNGQDKTAQDAYDMLVIGSGQGGTPLAMAFAKAGKKTALIEAKHVGGTCINEGCTPTKTMVASGRSAYMACGAKSMGVEFKRSSLQLNLLTVRKRKRDIVESFRGGSEKRIADTPNLDLIRGKAKFLSSAEVSVALPDGQTKVVTASKIFINVGCRPAPLDIKDVDVVAPGQLLDSTSVMELDEVPRHLLVIGGGPIGLEFAQLFRRFGADVSIVSRSAHLLPKEDPEISEAMEKILVEDGIHLYLSAQTQWFSKIPTGTVILSINAADGETKSIIASHVLNATGRKPNTEDLAVGAAGIDVDSKGFIKVDEYLRTSAPEIFAMGDVKGGPAFTHISYDDYRILKDHHLISPAGEKTVTGRLVPYCVFTDPQLGRVGLTEREARRSIASTGAEDSEARIRAISMPMTWVARALETGETRGLMKAVVDMKTDKILGFACLGYEGGEVMSAVQLAMMGGLTWRDLRDGCFAHPCLMEALNNLFALIGDD